MAALYNVVFNDDTDPSHTLTTALSDDGIEIAIQGDSPPFALSAPDALELSEVLARYHQRLIYFKQGQ